MDISLEALVISMLIIGGAIYLLMKIIENLFSSNDFTEFFTQISVLVCVAASLIAIVRIIYLLAISINTILIAL